MKLKTMAFILNVCLIIAFTALAIVFDKWWIILFIGIFKVTYRDETEERKRKDE